MTQSTDYLLWTLLRGLFVIYALIVGGVYLLQRKLQYFPNPQEVSSPLGSEYLDLKTVQLVSDDGTTTFSWYWPSPGPLTLVFFHGNGGNRGNRLSWIQEFHRRGYGVFILDYRGYGGSAGTPTENGFYQDGQAAIEWLRKNTHQQLIYFGESLGSGVAVEMAIRLPPAALIIQSGFSSAVDVAKKSYPYLPVSLIMKDRYESLKKIDGVTCPLLVIHGQDDSTIPFKLVTALYEAAPGPKDWFLVPKANHNDVASVGGQPYWDRIESFLLTLVITSPKSPLRAE